VSTKAAKDDKAVGENLISIFDEHITLKAVVFIKTLHNKVLLSA